MAREPNRGRARVAGAGSGPPGPGPRGRSAGRANWRLGQRRACRRCALGGPVGSGRVLAESPACTFSTSKNPWNKNSGLRQNPEWPFRGLRHFRKKWIVWNNDSSSPEGKSAFPPFSGPSIPIPGRPLASGEAVVELAGVLGDPERAPRPGNGDVPNPLLVVRVARGAERGVRRPG